MVPTEVKEMKCETKVMPACNNVEKIVPKEVCSPVQRQVCKPVEKEMCVNEPTQRCNQVC